LCLQVISIEKIDGSNSKVQWQLSDGHMSFPATVDCEIASGVPLHTLVVLEAFKLIKYVCAPEAMHAALDLSKTYLGKLACKTVAMLLHIRELHSITSDDV